MVSVNASELLNVMRQMAMEAQGAPKAVDTSDQFSQHLNQAIDSVSNAQLESNNLAARFEQNDPEVNLSDVMVSMQKANLSFQALTQVRNKFVSAYQDIMNMPI